VPLERPDRCPGTLPTVARIPGSLNKSGALDAAIRVAPERCPQHREARIVEPLVEEKQHDRAASVSLRYLDVPTTSYRLFRAGVGVAHGGADGGPPH
jgi:hypothetical protein